MPRLRSKPEDFRVEEVSLYEPTGSGSFLWLWIEKTGRNTQDVAGELARKLELAPRDVGFAGRKDRHAITRQAFTVPADVESRLDSLELESAEILAVEKTDSRLRTGQLAGNRFRLKIREVEPQLEAEVQGRFEEMVKRGMPNRFGAQRFGRDGRNVQRGREILESTRVRGDRRRAWLMVSALQSAVFNEVLKRRPHDELWPGDVAVVHATDDWFWVDDPEAEAARLANFQVSPTGPIFGTKSKRPQGRALELEQKVMAVLDLQPVERMLPPKGIQIYGDRRSLRVRPQGASLHYVAEEKALQLDFELAAGSYATVLVEELFGGSIDEGPAASEPNEPRPDEPRPDEPRPDEPREP